MMMLASLKYEAEQSKAARLPHPTRTQLQAFHDQLSHIILYQVPETEDRYVSAFCSVVAVWRTLGCGIRLVTCFSLFIEVLLSTNLMKRAKASIPRACQA